MMIMIMMMLLSLTGKGNHATISPGRRLLPPAPVWRQQGRSVVHHLCHVSEV